MVPDWARPNPDVKPTTNTYLDEEHYAAFADFVDAFVRHFRGRVDYIVVWNEPNISLEWGYRPVDPAGLYRAAARRLSARQGGQPGRDRPGRGAGPHAGAGGRPGRDERPGLSAADAGGRRRRGDGRAGRPRLRLAAAARRPGRPGEHQPGPRRAAAPDAGRRRLRRHAGLRHRGGLERPSALDQGGPTVAAGGVYRPRLREGAGRVALVPGRCRVGLSLSRARPTPTGTISPLSRPISPPSRSTMPCSATPVGRSREPSQA